MLEKKNKEKHFSHTKKKKKEKEKKKRGKKQQEKKGKEASKGWLPRRAENFIFSKKKRNVERNRDEIEPKKIRI